MPDLIGIEEARRRVLSEIGRLDAENVAFADALGRVLAEEVKSTVDVPRFDGSAMDGFAVAPRAQGKLRIIGESRAGHPAAEAVAPGTAIRISTGAVVPAGTGAVVPVERVSEAAGEVEVPLLPAGANIRRAGEDITAGTVVLGAGTVLGPAELGVLASLGRSSARCARRPRVALLATGDELAPPGTDLSEGQIWSSNPVALAAQVSRAGGAVVLTENVPDSFEGTRDALARAFDAADLVCVSGGVSVGPHDHVKAALADLGAQERFWGVALKPGKPAWFGILAGGGRRVPAFGLPGNPVSAMVTFHLFALPALRAMQGADPAASRVSVVLAAPVKRSPARDQAVRCRLEARDDGWHAQPTGPQGSHMLTSMLGADALALIPAGEGEVSAGERVQAELLG